MTARAVPGKGRPAGALRSALATSVSYLYLVVATVALGIVAIVASRIPPRGRHFFRIAGLWAKGWLVASGVRLRVVFEARLDPDRAYVFMANHQSYFDIPALLASLPLEVRFMAKKSLFQIPIFGSAIRSGGFITVDRQDQAAGRESFAAAVEGLRDGASVLIFPEGTRSPTGELQDFRRGGFLMALRTGHAVVPVGIRGSFEIKPRGRWWIRPGRLDVRYGRPIEVDGYGVRRRPQLMADVRARIAALAGGPPGGG